MNIHPIFVYFPIALLTVYALLEVLRFRFIQKIPGLLSIKTFLVVTGTLGALVALQTGGLAEQAFRSGPVATRQLIETHSTLAGLTTFIFGLLAVLYIISLLNTYALETSWMKSFLSVNFLSKLWKVLVVIVRFCMKPVVLVVLAFVGLIAVTMTGALGGAIVYGPNIDPVVSFVYHLFF